jgi:hypothetical protein
LHTVLSKTSAANHSPRLFKANSIDEKFQSSHLKRPKLNSTSSDTDLVPDSDNELAAKRSKLEQIDEINTESSPKPSESNLTTE